MEQHRPLHELFAGSWIDEAGSAPGVDLGTWIGEDEENRAWELLGRARAFLKTEGVTPGSAPEAFEALYIAEGSDWFWWLGSDQDSGRDEEFDDLFRTHLRNVYRARGATPPEELDTHIVPRSMLWTHVAPVHRIQPGDRLSVRTHCPGLVEWSVDGEPARSSAVTSVGGVMAGASRYQLTLGPFPESAAELHFRFECRHEGCPGTELCCDPRFHTVRIAEAS
jgi:hypothetical protein